MAQINLSCQPLLDRFSHIMSKAKLLNKIGNHKSVEGKVIFCLSNLNGKIKYDEDTLIDLSKEISNFFEIFAASSSEHRKSEAKAQQYKVKGSAAFMKRKDDLACQLYTDGLRFAQFGSPSIAVLYANRSASHFHRKKYKECLEDIKRAEQSGYPLEATYKLHKRKIESLLNMGRSVEAREALRNAKISKDQVACGTALDSYVIALNKLEKQLEDLDLNDTHRQCDSALLEVFIDEGNEMSGALEIRVNEEEGRHILVRSDIPKGSVLFKEHPFAAVLLPEYFLTHCQQCFASFGNPIPCDNCCDVLWCNEECRDQGLVFHRFECGNLHILTSVGIAHLALRIVLLAGWSLCQHIRTDSTPIYMTEEDQKRLFHSKDKVGRYKAVYSLVNHLEKATPEDQFQYCLAGIILGKAIMERTNFLDSDGEKTPVCSAEVDLPSIIVHHISQLVSNAHAITQINESSDAGGSALSIISQKRIATAIYPLASLMNHSCKPSIINSFHGEVLVIHATEEIKEGNQLYNCYGPHACRQERADRLVALERQYFFPCSCVACSDESLLIKEASWSGLKCPVCRGIAVTTDEDKTRDNDCYRCFECKATERLPPQFMQKCSEANTLYEEGLEFLKKELYSDAEKCFIDSVKTGEEVFAQNNEFLNTIRDNLAKTYAMQGKFMESLHHLDICLKTVESRFGKDSVETAHELLKFLDVVRMAKTLSTRVNIDDDSLRKRVEVIFSTHYGECWKKYLRLNEI